MRTVTLPDNIELDVTVDPVDLHALKAALDAPEQLEIRPTRRYLAQVHRELAQSRRVIASVRQAATMAVVIDGIMGQADGAR